MHFFFLLPDDNLGGAELVVYNMVKQLKIDHSVKVGILKRSKINNEWDILLNSQVEYFSCVSHINGILHFVLQLISKKRSSTIVFTTHSFLTIFIALLKIFNLFESQYLIARESTRIFKRYKGLKLILYNLFYRISYSKVSILICQSEEMKSDLVQLFPKLLKTKKILVLDNPFEFTINKVEEKIISDSYIVAAGRLINEKGFDLLINAFFKVNIKFPKLQLIILGEGKERKNLEKLIDSYQLNNSVRLYGHVSDVIPYFLNAKVCILSSRIEGFPNVLLQMMSVNNSVISTNCVSSIELIPGIIVAQKESIDDLYKKIIQALSDSNNERNRLLFNKYLEERTTKAYIEKILNNTN